MAEDLVGRLVRIQEAHGWTDEQMAAAAGLTRPMWATVRARKTRLGHRSLGSIIRQFPELREEVLTYLADKADESPDPKTPVAA